MGAYKHYRNPKEPGVPLFITTTALDFVHAFSRTEAKDAWSTRIVKKMEQGGR